MRESSMAVLVTKGLSSEWGKMDWERVLAGLNEAVRMELGQRRVARLWNVQVQVPCPTKYRETSRLWLYIKVSGQLAWRMRFGFVGLPAISFHHPVHAKRRFVLASILLVLP